MKHIIVLVLIFVLVVACLSTFAYTQFVEQIILPVPTLKAREGGSLYTLLQTFKAEEEVTIEVKRGMTSISRDEDENLFDLVYTPDELDRLMKLAVNLVINLNTQRSEENLLTQVDEQFPAVRENLYLVGRFIDNFPFGFRVNIKFQSSDSNI